MLVAAFECYLSVIRAVGIYEVDLELVTILATVSDFVPQWGPAWAYIVGPGCGQSPRIAPIGIHDENLRPA